jgi:acyl CoA:acetate/3-ketoacid CoA transferase beta subunit
MVLAAAEHLSDQVRRTRPAFIFAGIGTSSLAAWVAHASSDRFPILVSEMGLYDYVPEQGDPWLFSTANMSRSSILSDTETVLGAIVQGTGPEGLAILAAAQVDSKGRLNTTLANGRFITGSGGANDVASGIGELIVLIPHDPARLVSQVDYVTSPGERTVAIVTDRAVFVREDDEFVIGAVVCQATDDVEAVVASVVADTPWPVGISANVRTIEADGSESLARLRSFDPHGHFLTERKSSAIRRSPARA